jgi:alanyl-tRNA synthetase
MATRRLYYDDSFLREFDAQVLYCEPTIHATAPAWKIILDQTALYPDSGGQPHDLGRLGDAAVLEVRDDGEEIVHVVDRGVSKGSVHGCIEWTRRMDHMQQHTGQHLLSAIFAERFGRATVSFHMGGEVCTIDLRGPEPTELILEGAQLAANQVIADDRDVTIRYGTAAEFADRGVRKEVQREGILRALEIEGVDLQPCGGTHVKRTSQIGMILVRKCAKVRQDWRVEFVCGVRAVKASRRDFLLLRGVAERLACSAADVVEAAGKAVAEKEIHFKQGRTLSQRLAEAEATSALGSTAGGVNGVRVVTRVFSADTEAEYLAAFAACVAKSEKAMAIVGNASGHIVLAQHSSVGKDLKAALASILGELGGKGGGTRDFARGRLSDAGMIERSVERATEILGAS